MTDHDSEPQRRAREVPPLPSVPMPTSGLMRLNDFLPYVRMSAQSWRDGVKAGVFPRPRIAGKRLHLWRAVDIRNWIEGLDTTRRRRAS